jgi:hypothetical protein
MRDQYENDVSDVQAISFCRVVDHPFAPFGAPENIFAYHALDRIECVVKTEKGMLKTQWLCSDRPLGWLRTTGHRRDWTPHLGNLADTLVPEP